MATVDELRARHRAYALALGYMVMEAALVELFLSTVAQALYEHDATVSKGITQGSWPAARVADLVSKAAKAVPLEEPLQSEVIDEMTNVRRILKSRNTMLHAVWDTGTVFDELPSEASRLDLRGLVAKATPLDEIDALSAELHDSWQRLAPLAARVALAF